jgi:hypothetical protein
MRKLAQHHPCDLIEHRLDLVDESTSPELTCRRLFIDDCRLMEHQR